jgi:hypothetical protein
MAAIVNSVKESIIMSLSSFKRGRIYKEPPWRNTIIEKG